MTKFLINHSGEQTPRPSQTLWGNLLLLVCSILVSLSVAELLIRRYYPLVETIYALDRRYLHRHIPYSRAVFRLSSANGGTKVVVTINGEGRRGDPVSPTKPPILV
jgi:hypothetical protein